VFTRHANVLGFLDHQKGENRPLWFGPHRLCTAATTVVWWGPNRLTSQVGQVQEVKGLRSNLWAIVEDCK
jgi:hypothetical protein